MADKSPTNPKGSGRKPLPIDWAKVERLMEAGCVGTEIAAYLGIHANTFYRRCEDEGKCGKGKEYGDFSAYLQSKKEKGDSLLRAKQFEIAMQGDKTMLVWLGKNRLNQADKIEQRNTSSAAQPSTITIDGVTIRIA